MADFRKWLLAFAVVALLLGTGISVQAQNGLQNQGTTACTVTAATPLIRAEGFTEQVGDIVITCSGGTPTQSGQQIGLSDVRVGLNTNITSRINPTDGDPASAAAGGPPSEALLILDNAYETPTNPTSTPSSGAPTFKL